MSLLLNLKASKFLNGHFSIRKLEMDTTTSEFTSETPALVPNIPMQNINNENDTNSDTVSMKPISYRVHSGRPDGNGYRSVRVPQSARVVPPKSLCCLII